VTDSSDDEGRRSSRFLGKSNVWQEGNWNNPVEKLGENKRKIHQLGFPGDTSAKQQLREHSLNTLIHRKFVNRADFRGLSTTLSTGHVSFWNCRRGNNTLFHKKGKV